MFKQQRERGFAMLIALCVLFMTTVHGAYFFLAYEAQLQTYKSLEFMKLRVTMEILNSYRNM